MPPGPSFEIDFKLVVMMCPTLRPMRVHWQLNAQCVRDKESVERRLKLVCDGVDHRSTRAPEYTEVRQGAAALLRPPYSLPHSRAIDSLFHCSGRRRARMCALMRPSP